MGIFVAMKVRHTKYALGSFLNEERHYVSLYFSLYGDKELPSAVYLTVDIDPELMYQFVRSEFPSAKTLQKTQRLVLVPSDEGGLTQSSYSDMVLNIKSKKSIIFFTGKSAIMFFPGSHKKTRQWFVDVCQKFLAKKESPKPHIYIPFSRGSDVDINRFEIGDNSIDVNESYNEDFLEVHNRILTDLVKPNSSGLTIFHGPPGTGKTSYIRHMSSMMGGKKVIYIPPDMASWLASPSSMSFMMRYSGSVLIIEDAEEILRPRSIGGSAVSTILNMTDGLLGDCLSMQIVCTFNADLSSIDEALLRPGRLVAKYHFGPLAQSKADPLAEKNGLVRPGKDATLAEIFSQPPVGVTAKRKIGFAA